MIDPLLTGKVGIVTGTDNPQGIGISIARSLSPDFSVVRPIAP
jgi:hypothetical protein